MGNAKFLGFGGYSGRDMKGQERDRGDMIGEAKGD